MNDALFDEFREQMPDLFEGAVDGVWLAFRLRAAMAHGYRAGLEAGESESVTARQTDRVSTLPGGTTS